MIECLTDLSMDALRGGAMHMVIVRAEVLYNSNAPTALTDAPARMKIKDSERLRSKHLGLHVLDTSAFLTLFQGKGMHR